MQTLYNTNQGNIEEVVHLAKPSIFSRDYEKKMRKRKRRIITTIILVIVVVIGVFLKFELKNIDFSNMRQKIQAWVDSGKPEEKTKDNSNENKDQEQKTNEKENEKDVVEKDKEMELVVSDTLTVKVKYSEEDGTKKFLSIDNNTNISYDISPSGDKIIIEDDNQNVILFNVNGDKQDITKQSYTSQSGSVFMKNDILQSYEGYIWHEQVKFIDDSNIVYVSQLPYFGSAATNKYLWIYNIDGMTETCLWNYYGANIVVGNIDVEKGINVNIDNNNYYLKPDGSVTQ